MSSVATAISSAFDAPPPTITRVSSSRSRTARTDLDTSTSTTACSKEAAMSATGTDSPDRSMVSTVRATRSEEHTSELQSRGHLVCRLLLEKKKHKEE